MRCARCSHITSVPPPATDMAQLACTNPHCRVQLMYPRGALHVQCSLCGTLNDAQQANQLGHVACGGCHTTLMYAYGAQSVKCAVCNHVTPVASRSGPPISPYQPPHQQPVHQQQWPGGGPGMPSQSGASGGDSSKPMQAVLVENPPTLDEGGNEVQNVALGLTPKQEKP